MKAIIVALLALITPALADDERRAAQAEAAQVVIVARVAGVLCPGVEVDEDAIQALMDHAQITNRDIMGPDHFGAEDEEIARSLNASIADDPSACGKVFLYLAERTHLLRRKP